MVFHISVESYSRYQIIFLIKHGAQNESMTAGEKVLGPLELESQVALSCLTWVLVTRLGPLEEE